MKIHYPLETPRLHLTPLTATDGDALHDSWFTKQVAALGHG